MNGIALFEQETWSLGSWFGIDNALLTFNIQTIINTWVVLLFVALLAILARSALKRPGSLLHYMVLTGTNAFIDFSIQIIGFFNYTHIALAFSVLIFILLCNWIALFPWAAEPTKDLNTTLALGVVVFLYKDWQGIRAHGFKNFLKEFIDPIFLMLPINIIGHFSKLISISFRLFGNIFGGSIIMELYRHAIESSIIFQIIGLLSGFNLLITAFFGIFEGLIQAFVFAMLSLTYLALALQKETHD